MERYNIFWVAFKDEIRLNSLKKAWFKLFCLGICGLISSQAIFAQTTITAVYTDFNGFIASSTVASGGALNTLDIDAQNNLLAYTVGATPTNAGQTFSTGVNDAVLSANGVAFTPGNYKALIPSFALSRNAGQGANDDGFPTTFTTGDQIFPTPGTGNVRDVRAYLTDGVKGLGFSTFANNVGAAYSFDLSGIRPSVVGDGQTDLIYFNMAAPSGNNVTFELYSGTTLLGSASSPENAHDAVAVVRNDRFRTGNGTASGENSRQRVQGFAVELADFTNDGTPTGTPLTQAQMDTATELRVALPNTADPPFIGYNADAFEAVDPLACGILELQETIVGCNNNNTSNNVMDDTITFTLNPLGNNLSTPTNTYQVVVSSGTLTPTSATYGSVTTFTLQNATEITVTVTVSDTDDEANCNQVFQIPGACCDIEAPTISP